MTMTDISGHGAVAKIEIEGTLPDDDGFEGRAIFELRDGKVRITNMRQRPGGREYAIQSNVELEALEHIIAVLKGEKTL